MEEQILSSDQSLDICRRTVTTDSFIKEAKQIFGDLYDYRKVQYINCDHMVTITCPVHGDFRVYAREHLDGIGCPMCAQKVKEASYEEVETRKSAMKKANEDERNAWVDEWYRELQKRQNKRWSIITNWDFSKPFFNINLFDEDSLLELDPFDFYKQIVDEYINVILSGNKRQRSLLGIVPLSDSEAQRLSNYRAGDTYYLFQGQASIKNVKRYVYENYNANEHELCRKLSHRNCHICFLGEDLLIRVGRKAIFGNMKNVTETLKQFDNLRNTGLSVFICAKDCCFYITDDISMEEACYKDDPIMWVSVPFDNNCSEHIIKYTCDKHLAFLYTHGIFRTSTEYAIYR